MEESVSGVGVLDKAVAILAALEPGPATLTGLVELTGLTRATAHRLAQALGRHGLVERDVEGRFCLGRRLTDLGAAALAGPPLALTARPALEALRDRTGESAQLYVAAGESRLCVASLESPHSLRTIVAVGASLPMDRGSAGAVLRGASGVGRRGWVESVEEREKGVASVSAPVRRHERVVAAVSVSGPVDRTSRTPGRRYGAAVVDAARQVEQAAGWTS
ncbi:MAG TPA: IclR family transcriptional regulator C-terminal domain-containing protein [Actinomycetota bacterium]|nr:IclR family transcriptional regulator C-terminal domain-containing protein [Actinomycetota bacterium]